MRWGIVDTDGLWVGTDDGPLLYDDEMLARAAMTVLWYRCAGDRSFDVRPYPEGHEPTKRDAFTPPVDYARAIRQAEGEA